MQTECRPNAATSIIMDQEHGFEVKEEDQGHRFEVKEELPVPAPKRRKIKKERPVSPKNLGTPASTTSSSPGQPPVPSIPSATPGVTRSISACQRCRGRKTRCDQKFPSCTACVKAGVDCVGIDAATGREIPRSYVSHLEDRVAYLELQLQKNGISYYDSPNGITGPKSVTSNSPGTTTRGLTMMGGVGTPGNASATGADSPVISSVDNLMSTVGMVSVKGSTAAPSSFLGSTSGLSFARLLFTAVKLRAPDMASGASQPSDPASKTKQEPAMLPSKDEAESYLSLFFSQSNPQIPIFHREDFIRRYYEPIYGRLSSSKVSLASDFTPINVEFEDPDNPDSDNHYFKYYHQQESAAAEPNSALYFLNLVFGVATSIHNQQYPAHISESFRVAAMNHIDPVFSSVNRLETLQGMLLLALYSIMRPAVPGVWYVLGSATRLCIDLGLHSEGGMKSWRMKSSVGTSSEEGGGNTAGTISGSLSTNAPLLDPFIVDLKRRLFWCTYALDRQISVYLGRPFGIPEESIKVPFPSELDDSLITPNSFPVFTDLSREVSRGPSYKVVSLSFFKIRIIQAEIQRILYDCADLPRWFSSLKEWTAAMARKLDDWYKECPKSTKKMNCNFNFAFLDLNYHQTRLLLYGLCPANTTPTLESYMIIADAGEKVIKRYHELHRRRCINYTWAAVHNLFTAGTSYLYALYYSPQVRANTTIDEIDFNTLACIHVLSSMIDRCDAAAGCRDSFELLTAAILRLCYNEQAGITMQLNNGKHVNKEALLLGNDIPTVDQIATTQVTDFVHPHVGSLVQNLPVTKENKADQTQDYSNNGRENPSTEDLSTSSISQLWPQSLSIGSEDPSWSDELDIFFQQAAQLEGISPDSAVNNLRSPDKLWAEPPSVATRYNNSLRYETSTGPPAQNAASPGFHPRNDGQRIYDIINEVPLAPIWDQFFAPSSSSSSIYTGGSASSGGGASPFPDVFNIPK